MAAQIPNVSGELNLFGLIIVDSIWVTEKVEISDGLVRPIFQPLLIMGISIKWRIYRDKKNS